MKYLKRKENKRVEAMLLLVFLLFFSCKKDVINWNKNEYRGYSTPLLYLSPLPGEEMHFERRNLLDTAEVQKAVTWRWDERLLVNEDTIYGLWPETAGADVLLDDYLPFFVDWENGTLTLKYTNKFILFNLDQAVDKDSMTYTGYQIGGPLSSYWKSPETKSEFNGKKVYLLECGIDSNQTRTPSAVTGKSIHFIFAKGVGIISVELQEYKIATKEYLQRYLFVRKE